MTKDIAQHVSTCHACQTNKSQRKAYGHLPAKTADDKPWQTICVDLIGPYTIDTPSGTHRLHAMTMLDPATGWFEITEIPNKQSISIANKFDQIWLCRYPRPQKCIYDNGKEFTGTEFTELLDSYNIKKCPTTIRNPSANMVERVHLTLGNMLRTQELEQIPLDKDDPWSAILHKCAWAIRSTVHTSTNYTPAQLVFGRDMIFDLAFKANWNRIREKKQEQINNNNQRENARRIKHTYKINDRVLKDRNVIQPKLHRPRDGPFRITKINSNGMARISNGIVSETVSFRRLHPYKSA